MGLRLADWIISKENISRRSLRVGLLFGVLVYAVFGVLDLYAAPETFRAIWIIRLCVVVTVLIIVFLLRYPRVVRTARYWLPALAVLGQIGITAMLALSQENELAYYSYYAGLILMILWASFIFQITTPLVITISVLAVILYNIVTIGLQDWFSYPSGSLQYAVILNNNFFLISSAVFGVIGSYQINRYSSVLKNQNRKLKEEKEAMMKAKEKAEESDRLKSAFLANMSHEIRTPMNAILGFTELLNAPDTTKEQADQFSSIIHSRGHELLQLINDIIDSAKIEANELRIHPVGISMSELLKEICMTYEDIILQKGKSDRVNLQIENSLDQSDDSVRLDRIRLLQVLSNLLNNAVKFTDEGTITLAVERIGRKLFFRVQDEGIGVPYEKQAIIFERFRQADEGYNRTYGGTGLGLSIVKNLIELQGGKIWLESEPGTGTAFYFTLPFHAAVSKTKVPPEKLMTPAARKEKHLLVVEDDPTNFFLLEEILQREGYHYRHAETGEQAVQMYHERTFDLILMDIKLPGMDGYEATRRIREKDRDIPIIVVTAYAMANEKDRIMKCGCTDYISKPVNIEALSEVMTRHIT